MSRINESAFGGGEIFDRCYSVKISVKLLSHSKFKNILIHFFRTQRLIEFQNFSQVASKNIFAENRGMKKTRNKLIMTRISLLFSALRVPGTNQKF